MSEFGPGPSPEERGVPDDVNPPLEQNESDPWEAAQKSEGDVSAVSTESLQSGADSEKADRLKSYEGRMAKIRLDMGREDFLKGFVTAGVTGPIAVGLMGQFTQELDAQHTLSGEGHKQMTTKERVFHYDQVTSNALESDGGYLAASIPVMVAAGFAVRRMLGGIQDMLHNSRELKSFNESGATKA